jgi:hypothetical protein
MQPYPVTPGESSRRGTSYSRNVRDIQQIRLQNLRFLVEECATELGKDRGAVAHLARLCNIRPSLLSMLTRHVAHSTSGSLRQVGDETATKLEQGMGKDPGWMDVDRSQARDFREAALLDRLRKLTPSQMVAVERVLDAFVWADPAPPATPTQPPTPAPPADDQPSA